ncbi:glyoxylate/hydroxypyruvate reductase A [Aquicoccus sp. G2-2]|uniref:2-hydroxyacid dehydrogenase n=1 Tax=Aquicoccus sp. G2-2 TaxID=3092120 RepID=UPI002AE00362|nr:glyoxylate/hydroxypyruvate reductase A [Aquicoccus sp. G2-2]MEA1112444.1 glyoxylate/hydroxypyruvate reductase A [Aquicoccus sp. G2-2]
MPINILFAARPDRWDYYRKALTCALDETGLSYSLSMDIPPDEVDYIVYASNSPVQDFTPFTRAKAVLNLWAGVEKIVTNPTLKIPLTRMVGGGLAEGMVDWVTGHTFRHHLGMDTDILNPSHRWEYHIPPIAAERPVTILGMGELGSACGTALARHGFPVTGWARRPKSLPGITCHHGDSGLTDALKGAQIVVLLLPGTPATENVINAQTLALLAPGAFIINPGRGTLIDDDALIAALDSGQLSHATLDVFRVEPLPQDHPFWAHPKITVTPHIASETRPGPAARVIAENVLRGERGEPFLHVVDRSAGY